MIEMINNLIPSTISKRRLDQIYTHLYSKYPSGSDHWGLDLEKSKLSLKIGYPLYRQYFRVRVLNKEKIQDRPYMVVSNHSGQIPIDAMLITCAFMTDIMPPRILRSMVERFAVALPFFGKFILENGAVLGDRDNCYHLMNKGESVLVFPEGVKGISKSTPDYYKLQHFTRGFFRLAIKSKTQILPIAVVGAEEFYPLVYQAKNLARYIGLPALPLSPLFPTLGLLGAVPMPSPVDIHIGDPYEIPEDIDADCPDDIVDQHVLAIQKQIQSLLNNGVKERRKFWGADMLGEKGALKTLKDKIFK